MSRKRREMVHGRKNARRLRERKPRYLVVSGGAVTEKWYFKTLASLCGVIIDYEQKNLSPSQLAKLACRLKDEADRDGSVDSYVKVWVVVDVDAFRDHLEAEKICRGRDGVELIISNPCLRCGCSTINELAPKAARRPLWWKSWLLLKALPRGIAAIYLF